MMYVMLAVEGMMLANQNAMCSTMNDIRITAMPVVKKTDGEIRVKCTPFSTLLTAPVL